MLRPQIHLPLFRLMFLSLGIGAALSQIQDGVERPIAYASKTLNRAQRAYCTTRRECLAVVGFVKHFRQYLYGRRFRVRTDHALLRWLTNFKDAEGMYARWIGIRTISPRTISPRTISPQTISPQDKIPPDNIPPFQYPPVPISPRSNIPPDDISSKTCFSTKKN